MDRCLVDPEGLAHGGLDVQRADVLPVLLEQGDQEVDGVHDVGTDLSLGHADVADGHSHAQHLLQLELDGGLGLSDLNDRENRSGSTGTMLRMGVLSSCSTWSAWVRRPPLLTTASPTHRLQDGLANGGGELAGLVEARAKETGNLLDDGVRSQESVVRLGCMALKSRAIR